MKVHIRRPDQSNGRRYWTLCGACLYPQDTVANLRALGGFGAEEDKCKRCLLIARRTEVRA